MPRYRKKPVEVDAERFVSGQYVPGGVEVEYVNLPAGIVTLEDLRRCEQAYIQTLEGRLKVTDGDWIITGVAGEKYPCKPEIFDATYEPAEVGGGTLPVMPPSPSPFFSEPAPLLVPPDAFGGDNDTVAIKSEITGQVEHIRRAKPTPKKAKTGSGLRVTIKKFVEVNGQRMLGPTEVYDNIATVEDRGEVFVLNKQLSANHAMQSIVIDKSLVAALDTE